MDFPRVDMDAVAALIKEVSAAEIMSRWRKLEPHEIRDKGVDDPVTDADEGAERLLSAALPKLLPGSTVIGEEAAAKDPALLNRLRGDKPVWVIDPVDGTGNFKDGSEVFCCMVALVQGTQTLAGWIYAPVSDEMTMAEKGAGTILNGEPVKPSSISDPRQMRAAVHLKYMPDCEKARLEPRIPAFRSNRELYCAGLTYVELATGKLDLATFWRVKPWDHAMGSLIVAEAGGRTAFTDGTPYVSDGKIRTCLLAVSREENFDAIRDILFPSAG